MTPEQAEDAYWIGVKAECSKVFNDYKPLNQRKCILAGFAAVIEAVEQEQTVKFVNQYLKSNA